MKCRMICAGLMICVAMMVFGQKVVYPQPILAEKDHVFGYAIDRDKNQLVLNYIYEEAGEFDESVGQAIVKFNGHYAVIDIGGTPILEPIYDDIAFIPEYKTYIVKLNGKTGVYNHHGQQVLPIKYDNIGATTDGWYEGENDGEWIYISPDGRVTSSFSEYLEWKNG